MADSALLIAEPLLVYLTAIRLLKSRELLDRFEHRAEFTEYVPFENRTIVGLNV
jgi:hypothetical protein